VIGRGELAHTRAWRDDLDGSRARERTAVRRPVDVVTCDDLATGQLVAAGWRQRLLLGVCNGSQEGVSSPQLRVGAARVGQQPSRAQRGDDLPARPCELVHRPLAGFGRLGERGQGGLDRRELGVGLDDSRHVGVVAVDAGHGVGDGLIGTGGEAAQPAAHGGFRSPQAGSDGPVPHACGVGRQRLCDDLYRVGAARQRDAGKQHMGASTRLAAGSSWAQLTAAMAGAQPASAGVAPGSQLALAVGTGQLACCQLVLGDVRVIGDDLHVGSTRSGAANLAHRRTRRRSCRQAHPHPDCR